MAAAQAALGATAQSGARAATPETAAQAALGERWPPGMQNDLAGAYVNRGNALQGLERRAEALQEASQQHGGLVGAAVAMLRRDLREVCGGPDAARPDRPDLVVGHGDVVYP